MSNNYNEWIIDRYEEYVRDSGSEGAELRKSQDAVAQMMLDSIHTGDLDAITPTFELVSGIVRSAIDPVRTQRRASFKKNSEYLKDAIVNPGEGIHVDPFLDRVFPLGSHDGRDKAFRYWTEGDLNGSVLERYRNAAAVMEAAKEHDEDVQGWVQIMRRQNVTVIGDCFKN